MLRLRVGITVIVVLLLCSYSNSQTMTGKPENNSLIYSANESNKAKFTEDSLQALEYFTIGDTSYLNIDTCLKYTLLAVPLLQKTNQWEKYVYCLCALSYCYEGKGDFEKQELNNAFAFEEAKKYLQSSNPYYQAAVSNLGSVYKNVKQDYPKALQHFKEATNLFTGNDDNLAVRGTVYGNIGDIYTKQGDFDIAILYYKEALVDFDKYYKDYAHKFNDVFFKNIEVYEKLAKNYQYQKDYKKAIETLNLILQQLNKSKKKFDSNYYLNAYLNLVEVYLKQNDLQSSTKYLNKASAIKKLTPGQKATVLFSAGAVSFEGGAYNSSLKKLERALRLFPAESKIEISKTNKLIGDAFVKKKEFEKGLLNYQNAITHLFDQQTVLSQYENPKAKTNPLSHLELIKVLSAKSDALRQYFNESNNIEYLETCLKTYFLISKHSDQIRQNYQSEESKLFLISESGVFYEKAIEVANLLYKQTNNKEYLHLAFFFSEKNKAVVLLDEIKSREVEGLSQLPTKVIEQVTLLKREINYPEKQISQELKKESVNENKIAEWRGRILKLKQAQLNLKDSIATDFPYYFELTTAKPTTINQIQSTLPDNNTAMISYFIGTSYRYAFIITKNELRLVELNDAFPLDTAVNNLLNNIRMPGPSGLFEFNNIANELYDELIGCLNISEYPNLIIIPDGTLGFLPFEILTTSKFETNYPKELPYLIRDYTISYAFSATILEQNKQGEKSKLNLLTVAPFVLNTSKQIPNSNEMLSKLSFISGESLIEEEASIETFKEKSGAFGILHFATHAYAKDSVHQQPAIEFFDGQLLLSDLYTLRLNAQLAVLTACETGLGNERKGEGILSLGRGFAYAGVNSLVTSQWAVNDKATSQIVIDFYDQLENGATKSVALRNAKLKYLKECSDTKSTPYYWAAFTPIGNMDSIEFEKNFSWNYYLLGGLILLIGLVAFFVRKK